MEKKRKKRRPKDMSSSLTLNMKSVGQFWANHSVSIFGRKQLKMLLKTAEIATWNFQEPSLIRNWVGLAQFLKDLRFQFYAYFSRSKIQILNLSRFFRIIQEKKICNISFFKKMHFSTKLPSASDPKFLFQGIIYHTSHVK